MDTRRPLLDILKKEEMLAIAIRNKNAFDNLSDVLSIKHVKRISNAHAMIWRIVRKWRKKHNELPDKGSLNAELHSLVAQQDGLLSDEEIDQANSFLDYAFDDEEHGRNISKSKKHTRVAAETCRQFLEEVHMAEFQKVLRADNSIPENIVDLLAAHRSKLEQLAALGELDFELAFPEGWDKREAVALFSTGNKKLDEMIGGGWSGQESVIFFAPFGTCKTTLAISCAAGLIKNCRTQYLKNKARQSASGQIMRPVVVLAFTENTDDHYRIRILSNLATVPWTERLAKMRSIDDLGDNDRPGRTGDLAYERKLFPSAEQFECEQDRVRGGAKLANKHLLLLNFTASNSKRQSAGMGGIKEVAAAIKAYFDQHPDAYPIAFILDHCSALVERQLEAVEGEKDRMRRDLLMQLPKMCTDLIGSVYNIPTLLFHQFSGEANGRSVNARLSHADAMHCKGIAQFVDFAVTSTGADSNQICRWEVTKHRRTPPMSRISVKIDGKFNDLVDCDLVYDKASGCMIKPEDGATGKARDNRGRMRKKTKEAYKPKGMISDD